jgi:hypothetical protein
VKRLPLIAVLLWGVLPVSAARLSAQPLEGDGISHLLRSLEVRLQTGDARQYLPLLAPGANRSEARQFAAGWFSSRITRAAVRERDRLPLPDVPAGDGYELYVDIFTEFGQQGRLGSWRLDVRRTGPIDPDGLEWQIASQNELSAFEGLYQLRLNAGKQLDGRNLVITSEDLELRIPDATVFVVEIPGGVTALAVTGRGEMTFAPPSEAERGQVRIFSGEEVLRTRIDGAFIRLNPSQFQERVTGTLSERPVDPRDLRRAEELFDAEVGKSFGVDLRDLSPELWSTVPLRSDFVAEVRTRGHDTLTYSRMSGNAEDIGLFDRQRRRTVSVYASQQKLAQRGPFYSEDDLIDYDIVDFDIAARFEPERLWMEGRTVLRLRVRSETLSTFSLRLARELTLSSVTSPQYGRLLAVRGLNQDSFITQLPEAAPGGTHFDLIVTYAGRLPPSQVVSELAAPTPDEAAQGASGQGFEESFVLEPEPSWLYSNSTYWYAQSTVSDFATARLRLTVPARYASVATGKADGPAEGLSPAPDDRGITWAQLTTVADRPVRYLSWLVTRLERGGGATATIPPGQAAGPSSGPAGFQTIDVHVDTNPRQSGRARALTARVVDLREFYGAILGEFPYPEFTLALVESDLPGGHSPPYFVQLNQPPPFSTLTWRNDPAYFANFENFFLAHEVAHQWWGQAVGWKNFHEQWISEGFAQYFALLYAQRERPNAFQDILRQLQRWSLRESEEGPVYLGYRLGHIENDSRIFRALVYNKGAAVLHMLRRLVGDAAFFEGLRRFYAGWRFDKAGTEDLRATFATVTDVPLAPFFDAWIYGQHTPRIHFDWRAENGSVVLRFEQRGDTVFVLPVTVTLEFADRTTRDETVIVDYRTVEVRLPIAGPLRGVKINEDHAAVAEFDR